MGLLDDFSTLSDSAKQYALNALARFGNGVGNTVQQIPGNAQRLAQGLLNLPHDISQTFSSQPGGLLSPQLGRQINQAMSHPQPANPAQWMDQGMALAGMAPVTAPIGMFIGQGAKTWDAIAAQKANEMLQAGHDPRQVWQQTGTMRGVDGHLRQEIPDNAAVQLKNAKSTGMTYLDNWMSHPDLQDAYPKMFNHDFAGTAGDGGILAMAKPGHVGGEFSRNNITVAGDAKGQERLSITLHELQHAIQQREGWAQGGSPDQMRQVLGNGELTGLYSPEELYNGYRNLAGEAEARLTQARMNLTPEQRLQHYPYDPGPYGLDVPQNQLIVRTR